MAKATTRTKLAPKPEPRWFVALRYLFAIVSTSIIVCLLSIGLIVAGLWGLGAVVNLADQAIANYDASESQTLLGDSP